MTSNAQSSSDSVAGGIFLLSILIFFISALIIRWLFGFGTMIDTQKKILYELQKMNHREENKKAQ